MNYLIELTAAAEKDLTRLDRNIERRVRGRLKELAVDPYSNRISKPLKMAAGERSARVGNWRVFYAINEVEKAVKVLAVRPRQEAYKKL